MSTCISRSGAWPARPIRAAGAFGRKITLGCALLLAAASCQASSQASSQCYGSVGDGRLEGAVQLPLNGPNFSAYSSLAATAGRTHVHAKVANIVVAAYADLAKNTGRAKFVYGETGLASGGPFRPHKTHQNGSSVDFFVPVRNAAGAPAALPSTLANRFGYDIEFDASGKFGEYQIDFPALAEHLYQLDRAGAAHGAPIVKLIIDPRYFAALYATLRGPYLRKQTYFMLSKPWVRHDEHFHVDFGVPCKLDGRRKN